LVVLFTGLIRGIGTVLEQKSNSTGAILKIATGLAAELKLGDSVAVNGVCLTVAALGPSWFRADMMAETLKSTNLEYLEPRDKVNLEPALTFGDRLGGHLVSGHVDCVGWVVTIGSESNGEIIKITVPAEFIKFIALKGSVAVNGVSLTIQRVSGDDFVISLIPHTMQETNLQYLKRNDRVNIEVDILARYVANILEQQSKPGLTESVLAQNGFR
jgi:riboflavin synthase